ncbi:glycosyltransferase family 2 protein, partial [Patescibacteria group bacterium]|nr:glycosyltransferase family 2 protein [Patescibacteria group bacterium]
KSILTDPIEIIIVDNASTDNSFSVVGATLAVARKNKQIIRTKIIRNKRNFGFSAGNNLGLKKTNPKSKYVLFLNPDTKVKPNTIQKIINFLKKNPKVDAATCKIILAKTNQLQPECHRGFPTPWPSFCYFTGLSKLFPKSKIFSGYFLGHLNKNKTHPIEACVGAFLIVKREIGDRINWWNEKYFMYGEDLDFCYKLKKHNFSLYYYPHCQIIHYQGISSGIKNQTKKLTKASRQTRLRSAKASTQAMRLFYQKNYFNNYNTITRFMVNFGISILQTLRTLKAKYL